jgi:predicted extracellular nuclease
MHGRRVVVEAIVVGDFQGAGRLQGFFLQQADDEADHDPATSEGLFVYDGTGRVPVAVGDRVRVAGTVREFGTAPDTLTELSGVKVVKVCGSGHTVTPAAVSLPVSGSGAWERVEGMAVRFTQTLTVTGNHDLGRYGEVALAPERLMTPTGVVAPGAAAIALQAQNDRSRLILDDASTAQNRASVAWPEGGLNAASLRTVRLGDRVNPGRPLDGVLDQRFGSYRLQPTGPVVFGAPDNPRKATPGPLAGKLRAAGFNLLNYFTSLDQGAPVCGPKRRQGCRGADSAVEFTRQRAKIVRALVSMDAHVVGLVELENNPVRSLADLVDGLNAATHAGRYAYIDTGTIGGDAIKVGLIYQPAKVAPVGRHAVLDSRVDARAITTLNRPALAQTFARVGVRADQQRFTVAVNHFKSKGGTACAVPMREGEPADPDRGDGQGNCNRTRTRMAHALADWLAGNPTADPTPAADRQVLILGDLNAYAREDPIAVLEAAGYDNLIARFVGEGAYSYQFAGQSGTLDHALANAAMARRVAGATVWHINADEPAVFDYNLEFKPADGQGSFYAPDAFRSSDHDPVIVGFD